MNQILFSPKATTTDCHRASTPIRPDFRLSPFDVVPGLSRDVSPVREGANSSLLFQDVSTIDEEMTLSDGSLEFADLTGTTVDSASLNSTSPPITQNYRCCDRYHSLMHSCCKEVSIHALE